MGGVDKLSLDVGGRTVLDRVLGAARPLCEILVVVGPTRPTSVAGVTFASEAGPGGGPVTAVQAGLDLLADVDAVLVLAGDLPLLTEEGLGRLLGAVAGDHDAAAALDHEGRPNPLLAAYAAGPLRARSAGLGPGTPAAALLPDRTAAVDLGPEATLNVNRPDDLARARALS